MIGNRALKICSHCRSFGIDSRDRLLRRGTSSNAVARKKKTALKPHIRLYGIQCAGGASYQPRSKSIMSAATTPADATTTSPGLAVSTVIGMVLGVRKCMTFPIVRRQSKRVGIQLDSLCSSCPTSFCQGRANRHHHFVLSPRPRQNPNLSLPACASAAPRSLNPSNASPPLRLNTMTVSRALIAPCGPST